MKNIDVLLFAYECASGSLDANDCRMAKEYNLLVKCDLSISSNTIWLIGNKRDIEKYLISYIGVEPVEDRMIELIVSDADASRVIDLAKAKAEIVGDDEEVYIKL